MRHRVDGRKFGRNTSHRLAMFRNLANSVIQKEQVITTVQKAKEARRVVDRLITLGKTGTPGNRRLAFDRTRDDLVVKKLFSTLADRYKTRAGGYTRVLKLADTRWGDAAEMAVLELVDRPELDRKRKAKPAAAEGAAPAAPAVTGGDPLKKMKGAFQPKKAAGEKKAKAPKAQAKAAAAGEEGEAKSASAQTAAKKPAAKKKTTAKKKAKSKKS